MNVPRPEAAACALAAALLEQGRTVHLLSSALTALSLAGLGLSSFLFPSGPLAPILLAGAALLGVAEAFFAVRVGFDAEIFRLSAEGRLDWFDVDRGLSTLGLAAQPDGSRSEKNRIGGAIKLFKRQGLATALQLALLLGALLAQA